MSQQHRSAPLVARLLVALPLFALAGFAAFGFLASFELASWLQRLPWLAGYALAGFACIRGAVALLRPGPRKPARDDGDPIRR